MNARRKAFTSVAAVPRLGAAALVLAALVVVIGSAQAAPSTKVYDATVRVVSGPVTGTSATLRLTLTNSTRSKQTLGSANFTKPTGITLESVTNVSRPQQFTAQLQGTNVVAFRSTVALKPGEEYVFPEQWILIPLEREAATPEEARELVRKIPANPFKK